MSRHPLIFTAMYLAPIGRTCRFELSSSIWRGSSTMRLWYSGDLCSYWDVDYDVALSYAGQDRAYVEQIAARLRQQGIRVFYDEYAAAELWGNDLYVLLDEVYRKRARFTVVFVSRYYASKPWTRHERQSAQARALTDLGPYLLPVRLDDSELPGLRPTVGYIDARNTSVEQLVWLIEQKLSAAPGMATTSVGGCDRWWKSTWMRRTLCTRMITS